MAKVKLTICWLAKGRIHENLVNIRERFGIDNYMSVNKETPCQIREEDITLLEECENRGFVQIRYKK